MSSIKCEQFSSMTVIKCRYYTKNIISIIFTIKQGINISLFFGCGAKNIYNLDSTSTN